MIAHGSAELLVELVDGELDRFDLQWIVPHVRRCVQCTTAIRDIVDARVAFGALLRSLDLDEPPEWSAALRTLEALGLGAAAGTLR